MATIAEIEKLVSELPDGQREQLIENLLDLYPPLGPDDDEVMRRSAEMDADPSVGVSLDEFKRRVETLRR